MPPRQSGMPHSAAAWLDRAADRQILHNQLVFLNDIRHGPAEIASAGHTRMGIDNESDQVS